MTILLLGIGNILLQDEGIGVHAVREFERRFEIPDAIELVDGGTSGMDLLDTLADRERVVIVDAVKTGHPPGTLVRLENEQVRRLFRSKISPHQLGLSDLLANLALMGQEPRELVLFGAVPESMETGLELSATLAAELDRLVGFLVEELARFGVALTPREQPHERRNAALG